MQKKYKLTLLLLFVLTLCFSKEGKSSITFIVNKEEILTEKTLLCVDYLIDIAETKLLEEYDNIILKSINGEVDSYYLKKVVNYVFSQGINGFYYINVKEHDNSVDVDIKLYNSIGNIMDEKQLVLIENKELKMYISADEQEEWLNIIRDSIKNILEEKKRHIKGKRITKRSIKDSHNFPFFSFGINAISCKLYFDDRMDTRTNKIFSFFPVDIRMAFFPLKYFELGLFFNFSINNMVYKYLDYNDNKYKLYDSNFVFSYGIFMGLSFFSKNSHYSFGIQMGNLFYDLSQSEGWVKTEDINSYFLPQFAFYQRLDLKIFKYLYFSILFSFKNLPSFYLKDNYFYSAPFLYDFFCVEISFVGFSIII